MKPVKPRKPIEPGEDEYAMSRPDGRGGATPLERREFLKLAGGGLVVYLRGRRRPGPAGGRPRGRRLSRRPQRLPQGRRRTAASPCFTGKIEMGQGIITSLAMMLAEELDVPLAAVDMVMGDTALCPYDAGTFGSRSTKYFGPPMRQAAAEARGVLVRLASARLGAAEEEPWRRRTARSTSSSRPRRR